MTLRATAERLIALSSACPVIHKWPFEDYVDGEALEINEPSESSLYAEASPQTITRLAKALIAAMGVIDIVRHDYSAIEIVDAVNAFDLATTEKQP